MSALLAIGYSLLALPQFPEVRALRQRRNEAGTSQWLEAISQWRSPTWFFMMVLVGSVSAQEVHIPLQEGWQFQQVGKEQWYPAEVPGVVHTDLLRNGLIPDPYKGSNVDSVQWIENENWIYKCTIVARDTLLKHGHLDLVFKGLDTFAEVYLNDSLVGKADNMFRSWEWPVKELLRKGENELKVIFRSPIKEGAKLREAYGIQLPHDNDPSGVSPYIRKAAYQFGWDFCPRLVTSGIWQGVELRGWSEARIMHAEVTSFQTTGGYAFQVRPFLKLPGDETYFVVVKISGVKRKRLGVRQWRKYEPPPIIEVDIVDAQLWWPSGMGDQPLYEVEVELNTQQGLCLSRTRSFVGICDIDLLQEKDSLGRSFRFDVNGRPFFAQGCNLVPPNLLLSGAEDGRWVQLVRDMKDAGVNMVRVWSGGVYPPDAFFTACDSSGILVWQDLMFASLVPSTKSLLETSRIEVIQQVSRIGLHPSAALWCGNNELEVAWRNWGWQNTYRISKTDQRHIERTNNSFFKRHMRESSDRYGGYVQYTPTSPLSNWGSADGLRSGDLHYWGVWHGDSTFASFKNNVGRFVSEYGFQSYPDSALLAKYIDPKELFLGSPALKHLQRSYKTDKPIWDAIHRELGVEPKTLGEFIEASQEVQAKAYRMAAEAHIAAQPHCMGTLLWQLNDCWPGPSWSIIDFEGRPKPAYDAIKEVYSRP